MQPKTKLIIYSIAGALLLSILIISFFTNQSVNHPKQDSGIYKEPERPKLQTQSQLPEPQQLQLDEYQCSNITADSQGICVALGWMLKYGWLMFTMPLILMIIIQIFKRRRWG